MSYESMLESLRSLVSGDRAKDAVAQISTHHRIQASPGYDDAARWLVEELRRSGLEPGSYTLEVHKTDQPSRAIQVDVADGQQVNLEIRLGDPDDGNERGGLLEVRVDTHRIDWGRVRLVRVVLDYPGSGQGDPDAG